MAGFAKKKYFKLAKGFYGGSRNCIRIAIPRVQKSLQKAYTGRRLRPRNLRRGWIQTINAAARDLNINYSQLVCGLNRSNIILDRKILADLAQNQPYSFKTVVDEIKIQNQIITKQRYYKLDQMIKRNLVTSAKLQKQDYKTQSKKTVKVHRVIDQSLTQKPIQDLFTFKAG